MNLFNWLRYIFKNRYFDGENYLEVKKSKLGDSNIYEFMLDDKWHRKDGPAFIFRLNDSYCLLYFQHGKLHRLDGPACSKSSLEHAYMHDPKYSIFEAVLLKFSDYEVNDGDYFYQNTKFNPEELGFEMPIDTVEKDTYMKLTFT